MNTHKMMHNPGDLVVTGKDNLWENSVGIVVSSCVGSLLPIPNRRGAGYAYEFTKGTANCVFVLSPITARWIGERYWFNVRDVT